MIKKIVFVVFLGIIGLNVISAQAQQNPWAACNGCRTQSGDFDVLAQMKDDSIRTLNKSDDFERPISEGLNHPQSPYFSMPNIFNLKSNKNLTILSHYPTYQQATESSCGPAAALTVLRHYGKKDTTEKELIKKMATTSEFGTSVKGLANYFRNLDWNVKTNLDEGQSFDSYEKFADFVQEQLKLSHPIMVENVFKGGHWRVIIGYDTMGTQKTSDDVLIFADTYDTADHYQDGYGIENAENFFWSWFDHQVLPENERNQPFVLVFPKGYTAD